MQSNFFKDLKQQSHCMSMGLDYMNIDEYMSKIEW